MLMKERCERMAAWASCGFLLVSIMWAAARAADINSDAQGLTAFLGGLAAATRVNWAPNASVCTWQGVICSVAPQPIRVVSLRLPAVGLYGDIPAGTLGELSALRVLSLRNNRLTGRLPADIGNLTELRSFYVQNNGLTGGLEAVLGGGLRQLVRVNLAFNKFREGIPEAVGQLRRLGTLYLENNSLTGALPAALGALPDLAQLSVAHNALNGSVPSSLQMRFGVSAFSGNAFCGAPLFPACPRSIAPSSLSPLPLSPPAAPPGSSRPILSTGYIIAIAVGGAVLLFLAIAACCIAAALKRRRGDGTGGGKAAAVATGGKDGAAAEGGGDKLGDDAKDEFSSAQEAERNKLVFFQGSNYTFDLEDLLRASAEVLGKGSVGTAYKAVLEDGSTVVVKRLKDVSVGRKEFEQIIEQLGRLQFRHLVPLRAYYYSKDEKLLLHDYMPLGSLSSLLHGSKGSGRTPLDWDTRVRIATGAAKGIAFLHEQGGGSKFVHGNIKSSNVLLSRDYTASVSDFGLAPLFGSSPAASRITGYRAPEVVETRKVTQKSDVYSFGVLLLELLTGKAPTQTSTEEGIDLPRWVQSVVREEWTAEVFDVELMRYQNIEEEMVQMLQVAMACVATLPDQRPTMVQIVKMIEDVRAFETDDGNRQSSSDKSKESNGHTPHRTPPESLTPARITP